MRSKDRYSVFGEGREDSLQGEEIPEDKITWKYNGQVRVEILGLGTKEIFTGWANLQEKERQEIYRTIDNETEIFSTGDRKVTGTLDLTPQHSGWTKDMQAGILNGSYIDIILQNGNLVKGKVTYDHRYEANGKMDFEGERIFYPGIK